MPQPKNVIILGPAYPLRGGLATYNERLAQEYQNKGVNTTIYTFSLQYPGFLFPGKTQYSEESPPANLNIEVCVNSINPLNWIKIGKKIKQIAPDILILRYWMPFMAPCLGVISRIAKKNKTTKVIAIIDNIIPHEKFPLSTTLSKFFTKSCDAFITMSKAVLQDLNNFDNTKPKIYNPHPLYDNFGNTLLKTDAQKHLNLDPNYKYLLFFGFIREYKGLDLLLEAFADSRIRNLPLKLIVAGEFYVDSKPYLQIIEQNHLRESILLHTDFIPNTEVGKYFCASDIVVQPYKTATQSGVTQIAYHFNKPMLITNVGGLSEIVPDGKVGYVVNPDKNDIANALVDFYNNEKETYFTENIKTEKKRFSWEILFNNINSLV